MLWCSGKTILQTLAMIVFATSPTLAETICFDAEAEETKRFEDYRAEWITKEHAPWMVNLSLGGAPFCGGVLIQTDFVLTAAHCVGDLDSEFITIRRVAEDGAYAGEARGVLDYSKHPKYKGRRDGRYDLAIVKLHRSYSSVSGSDLPIAITKAGWTSRARPGHCATTMGWGRVSEDGIPSLRLIRVNLRIWSNDDCARAYRRRITDVELCAGYHRGMFDTCQGDSGGPLIVKGGQNDNILVGIIARGRGCGRKDRPGIYTKITPDVRRWIYDEVQSLRSR